MSLTVYLAHPLVSSVLIRTTPLPEASLALALATVAGSLVLALGLALLPSRSRFLPRFLRQSTAQTAAR
jgi:surface polysaccharide O-acyltransferase-like enzyme